MSLQKIIFVDEHGKKVTIEAMQVGERSSSETIIERFFELEKDRAEGTGARLVTKKITADGASFSRAGLLLSVAAFIALILIMMWCGRSYAVVPASVSLEEEVRPKTQQKKMTETIEKIERHEEENIHLLEYMKGQLKEIK